ncbi:hypothetical protein COT75_03030 [Candidatus Beckwithbacteria bacterium CG10_big_fil_rev_8_21_14_0_10_34_10]|uniref:AFP-like domain-containing protein n=1 Tax=Candidatus Beckwithbacteria bacterium CG10_big_fil_rev_8_21_14_0_10_34_10 TaxID=1974495 RepID=A0A2H0WBD1_9BACT|nr:MAG: hypothetical protein COT75_03030 [Candidatus Beckwithbacteria bacterium CG10_big_fil_rev_8_21_14_0_10_34_10]
MKEINFFDKKSLIIAEVGINHNGNIAIALELVEKAAKAGADVIKFQTLSPETNFNLTDKDNKLYRFFKKTTFSLKEYQQIKKKAEKERIIFMSSAADVPSARLLYKLGIPGIKLSSSNFTNFHLISELAKYNLPLILSSGMATIKEMKQTYDFLIKLKVKKFAFLYCLVEYPTQFENINFKIMEKMRQLFSIPVGFSDHTLGITAAFVARAKGACIIEKHFTLDRKLLGPDQEISLEPDELRKLVLGVRDIEAMLFANKPRINSEKKIEILKTRRSLYAFRDLEKGKVIEFDDIAAKRPYNKKGIDPRNYMTIIGKKTQQLIKRNQLIRKGIF